MHGNVAPNIHNGKERPAYEIDWIYLKQCFMVLWDLIEDRYIVIEDRYDQESLLEITPGGGGGPLPGGAPPGRGTFF